MILKSQGQHKPKQHLDKVWGCRISNFTGAQMKDWADLASIDPASESLCRYAVSAASGARCRGKQAPLQKCIYSPNGPVWLVLLRKIVCVCSFIKMVPIEADRPIAVERHACLRSGECTGHQLMQTDPIHFPQVGSPRCSRFGVTTLNPASS